MFYIYVIFNLFTYINIYKLSELTRFLRMPSTEGMILTTTDFFSVILRPLWSREYSTLTLIMSLV